MSLPTGSQATTAMVYAGALIRYGFYVVAAVVLGMIGIWFALGWSGAPKQVEAPPAFRIAAPSLARLSVHGLVQTGARFGRVEVRQYGQLYDRDTDMTVALVMRPEGYGAGGEFVTEIRDIRPLRDARAVLSARYHDLETRFGEIRAAEMHLDADGRRKLCLAFISRFETTAFFLKGWYCEANGERARPERLACVLDRLTLDGPLPNKAAQQFVAERMTRGAVCSAVPVTQTTDTRRRGERPASPARWSMPNAVRY